MYELEPYLVDIPPNTRSLPFLSSCMITCELPTSPIFSLIILFGLWVLTDLSLNLINFKIVIFASCVCCINLILDHIWPTPSLGMKYTSVVKSTNRTMTVAILVIRNHDEVFDAYHDSEPLPTNIFWKSFLIFFLHDLDNNGE